MIDLAIFERFMREFVQDGGSECGLFFIGESTTKPAVLIDALKICKKIGVEYTFLTTNGSACTPELSEELMRLGLNSLKFSVNFESAEAFEQGAGVKGKLWRKAGENLKAAWRIREEKGYKTRLYASTIQLKGERDAKMQAHLDEHVIPYIDEHYRLPMYGEMSARNVDRYQEFGWKPNAGNTGRLGGQVDPTPCWALFSESHVRLQRDKDGVLHHMLASCCFADGPEFDMGDLNTMSFMEAWNSPEFQALRAAHLREDKSVRGTVCEECIHGKRNVIEVKAA